MSDLVASWEEPGDAFPISVFFAQQPWRLPKASRPQHQFPLCDLRDLCAMLSPISVFPTQQPRRPPKASRPTQVPPSVTSVTSVRCFPQLTCSHPSATAPTETEPVSENEKNKAGSAWLNQLIILSGLNG
jgi:hypothetical protein